MFKTSKFHKMLKDMLVKINPRYQMGTAGTEALIEIYSRHIFPHIAKNFFEMIKDTNQENLPPNRLYDIWVQKSLDFQDEGLKFETL